ncbi:hypothetical protein VULLAG_LOCUS6811 [Vulpes lagopus]
MGWVAFCLNVSQYVGSYREVQILMKKEELTLEMLPWCLHLSQVDNCFRMALLGIGSGGQYGRKSVAINIKEDKWTSGFLVTLRLSTIQWKNCQ